MPILIGVIAFIVFIIGLMLCVAKPASDSSNEYRGGLIVLAIGFGLLIWTIAATEKYFNTEPQINGPYLIQEVRNQDETISYVVVYEGAIVNLNHIMGKSFKKNDQVIVKRINGMWCYGMYYFQGSDTWEVFKPRVLPKDGEEIEFAKGDAYAISNGMDSARKRD